MTNKPKYLCEICGQSFEINTLFLLHLVEEWERLNRAEITILCRDSEIRSQSRTCMYTEWEDYLKPIKELKQYVTTSLSNLYIKYEKTDCFPNKSQRAIIAYEKEQIEEEQIEQEQMEKNNKKIK